MPGAPLPCGTMRGLLVAGTTSDAGKSVVTAGICRWLARQGLRVAPFKAQNMSLNSAVVPDSAGGWAEIGRAQAMQAAAAGIEAEAVMNPVLLKPGGAGTSQVVLLGHPVAEAGALDYRELRPRLLAAVLESLADLAGRHDVVVCEGAGSPAEINLREGDIVNMGLARAAGLPVVVVGDIDRGGVFAGLYGTLALLEAADQEHLAGWVINKFRGDERLLRPGLDMLVSLTGRPVLGVLPWVPGLWLDAEDSLDLAGLALDGVRPSSGEAAGELLTVAVVALPRLSNVTDLDALAVEPGVDVRLVTRPGELEAADLAVLPGTRSTVADLAWLRARGLDVALHRRAAAGRPVLGICGGYQMLAAEIVDDVESRAGMVAGLGLLPARVRFAREKTLGRPRGTAVGQPVEGYEIHHGLVEVVGGEPFLDGCSAGAVRGTSWHGIFENDGFRRAFLGVVAAEAGRSFVPSGEVRFADVRQARLDVLGDLVADHLDPSALLRLIDGGTPAGLPFVPPGGPSGGR
jgi:adenosylcobyric acid synthase